jgi:hypothetical protein
MKYLIPFILLAGCATQAPRLDAPVQPSYLNPPIVPIKVDPQVQQMSRNEVIQASLECEAGNMRPVPIMSKRIVSGMMTDIIIDVQCMPKRSAMF